MSSSSLLQGFETRLFILLVAKPCVDTPLSTPFSLKDEENKIENAAQLHPIWTSLLKRKI